MPYSLTLLDTKLTTVSGHIVEQIPNVSDYVTTSQLTTVSGDIVSYSNTQALLKADVTYVDQQITTTSGDIIEQIPSLSGYATEGYVGSSIATMSGIITQYVDIKDALEADLSYVDYKLTTTSGDLVTYVNTVSGIIDERFGSRTPYLVDVGPGLIYETVQAGIDACDTAGGDYYLVRVFPGLYEEDIVLKDNVDLVGLNYSACVIKGSVYWPSSTCTPDGWSCILDIYIYNDGITTSGYSLVTVEEGQHDLNNLWLVLTTSGVPGSIVNMSGGHLHGYMPTYQYYSLGDTSVDSIHRIFQITGGIYEEQSGKLSAEIEDSLGTIVGYCTRSVTATCSTLLVNPKISLISTAAYFDGMCVGVGAVNEGVGVTLEAGFIKLQANAGGMGSAFYLDGSQIGSVDNRVISNANRIEVTGFNFNYSATTTTTTDKWISHFDTITAQGGFYGELDTYAAVHSDEYGELHINKYIRFSPTSSGAIDRDLLLVEIGQVAEPTLQYQYSLSTPKLSWYNPEAGASIGVASHAGTANFTAGVAGDGGFEQDAQLTLRHDVPVSGTRRWRVKSAAGEGSFVIDHYRTTNSGEGTYSTFTQTYDGMTTLRYGVPVDRFLDESTMASYSPYALPTQKSVVDYVDTISGSLYTRFSTEYATQEDLITTSGVIMDYIGSQGAATIPYVDTVSGSLHSEVEASIVLAHDECVTTSGVMRSYVDGYIKPYRYIPVSEQGGEFNSIQAAIDSITVEDETDFWIIEVFPGVYYEDIYLKDNVSLVGKSYDVSILEGRVFWTTGCTEGWWSSIQNITVQAYPTVTGYNLFNISEGSHDIVNCYVYLEASGVGSNVFKQTGGELFSYLTVYEYGGYGESHGGGHRIVRVEGGRYEDQAGQYIMTVDDPYCLVQVFSNKTGEADSYIKTSALSVEVVVTNPTFSGSVMVAKIAGLDQRNVITSANIIVEGPDMGGGTAYGYYVDSGGSECTLHISSTRLSITGFGHNYGAYVSPTDHLYNHFCDIHASDGILGDLSRYEMVSSEGPGQLRVTDYIKIGNGLLSDQPIIQVDVGKSVANPTLKFDYDYFGYETVQWETVSGGGAMLCVSPEGPILMGSMSMGDNAFAYEQRLSVWAHETNNATPYGYERRGYRLKRNIDESFSISRHWTYEDAGAFVDLLNIDPWGGVKFKNSDVRISAVYDDDQLAQNSASGVATQRSTKAYVDAGITSISGVLVDVLSNNGFLHKDTAWIGFDDVSRTFTISGTHEIISSHIYYEKGYDQIQIQDEEGKHYIYYGPGGVLTAGLTSFDLLADAPIATVYWDKENQKSLLFAYEQHSTAMANATHLYLHMVRGMDWQSGLGISHNAITTGSPNSDNRNTWVSLTSGELVDEDITVVITNVSGTSTTMFAQDLGDVVAGGSPNRGGKFPVFYTTMYSGTVVWRKEDATDFPFIYNASDYPQISVLNGGNWELTELTTGFFISWVYGTPDVDTPIYVIPGAENYSTLVDAQEANPSEVFLNRSNKPTYETRILYKLIYEVDSGYPTECKYSALRVAIDYRLGETITVEASSASLHSALSDLGSSGHPASVITVDQSLSNFLLGYTNAQTVIQRIDSYVPTTYATKSELTSASGAIVNNELARVPNGSNLDLITNVGGQWVASNTGSYRAYSGVYSEQLAVADLFYASTSSGNVGFGNSSSIPLTFIDSQGRISVGGGNITGVNRLQLDHSGTTNKTPTLSSSVFEIDASDGAYSDFVFRLSADSGYPVFSLANSKGTLSAPTAVTSGSQIGALWFLGYDSNSWETAASIDCFVDGVAGNTDMPGRLEFKTTPDGSATSQTRMVIKSDGKVGVGTDSPSELLAVNGNLTSATGIVNTVRMNALASDPNPVTDGDRWYRDDNDFRVRENSRTFIDAVNSMAQCNQTYGIAQQDVNSTAVAINWNATAVLDSLYGHSDTTNSSRITVSGTAWYKVTYSVSHINQTNQRKNIMTQLRKNGTTYLTPGKASSMSYNTVDADATNYASSLHKLAAGDYIEVVASGTGSVGSVYTDQTGGTYIMVEFVRWSV